MSPTEVRDEFEDDFYGWLRKKRADNESKWNTEYDLGTKEEPRAEAHDVTHGEPPDPKDPDFEIRKECVMRIGSHIYGDKLDRSKACPVCIRFADKAKKSKDGSLMNDDGSKVTLGTFADICNVARQILREFEAE